MVAWRRTWLSLLLCDWTAEGCWLFFYGFGFAGLGRGGLYFGWLGVGGLCGSGVEALFHTVEFFAEVAGGFLEVEEFLAEGAEFFGGFAGGADFVEGGGGGFVFGGVGGGGGVGLEGSDGGGVFEVSQRVDGGEFDALHGGVELGEEIVAGHVAAGFVAGEVTEGFEGAGEDFGR